MLTKLKPFSLKSILQGAVLFAPILMLPLVLLELVGLSHFPTWDRLAITAVQNLLFFNTLHVIITFYFLVRYRGFRNALSASIEGSRLHFYIVSVALLALGPLTYVPPKSFGQTHVSPFIAHFGFSTTAVIFQLLYTFLALNHSLWQVRGIGLSYGANANSTETRFEKRLFIAFIALVLIGRGALILLPASHIETFDRGLQSGLAFSAALALALALVLMYRCYQRQQGLKALFFLRLIYFPLIPFSLAAAVITPCFHGMEYADYFNRLNTTAEGSGNNQKMGTKQKWLLALVVIVPGLILTLPYWGLVDPGGSPLSPSVVSLLVGVNFGLGYLHYYLDEKIFAFSNPKTRQALLPFLKP